ncbi:MAG: hypothetical protein PHY16_08450 [Methylobacter sp.]|nr:hypothetical protein [Methylobacter sp.]
MSDSTKARHTRREAGPICLEQIGIDPVGCGAGKPRMNPVPGMASLNSIRGAGIAHRLSAVRASPCAAHIHNAPGELVRHQSVRNRLALTRPAPGRKARSDSMPE